MKRTLNQTQWNRKEHFDFFNEFDEPYFGIVSEIDCTKAYQISKNKGQSFFAYYLHKSLLAVNQVEEFRLQFDADAKSNCDLVDFLNFWQSKSPAV